MGLWEVVQKSQRSWCACLTSPLHPGHPIDAKAKLNIEFLILWSSGTHHSRCPKRQVVDGAPALVPVLPVAQARDTGFTLFCSERHAAAEAACANLRQVGICVGDCCIELLAM